MYTGCTTWSSPLWCRYTTCAHYMYTTCTPHVHHMYTTCTLTSLLQLQQLYLLPSAVGVLGTRATSASTFTYFGFKDAVCDWNYTDYTRCGGSWYHHNSTCASNWAVKCPLKQYDTSAHVAWSGGKGSPPRERQLASLFFHRWERLSSQRKAAGLPFFHRQRRQRR